MKYIKWFEEVNLKDVAIVGGKNASLGEMIQELSVKKIIIPGGFATTADAYRLHLTENNLTSKLTSLLEDLDKNHLEKLEEVGQKARELILSVPLPKEFAEEIKSAYKELSSRYAENCDVAVRSSATAEDLPEASFAGQQETFLNIRGEEKLLEACQKAIASLFTNRAISYRVDHGFDHMDVALSVGVQKMVRSDKASSGVIFTLDTESGFKNVIFINSSYGIGESVVGGMVNPDEFYVHKQTLESGFKPILKKRCGSKKTKVIYGKDSSTKTVDVSEEEQVLFSLSDDEILDLSKQALIIEKHYSDKRGKWMPMDIEWAKDGDDGKLYIVQARPETIHANKVHEAFYEEYSLLEKGEVVIEGKAVGRKIVSGRARVIDSAKDMKKIKPGEVLVTDMTDPDWEPIMKIAAGIVTNRGGRTCHAAIVSRELGIPAIVGTTLGTSKIKDGTDITIDCSSEVGVVYSGELKFEVTKTKLDTIPTLNTKIMMNVGNPDKAFGFAMIPSDGVGLARLEFIINNSIYLHPMALAKPELVTDKKAVNKINELTVGYEDKKQFFIDKLAQETGTIAAAFYPKPVIIRFSDFKSNEYSKLIGGEFFEPEEENPMLGFRGASRYYHEKYKDAFALECLAMKKIREEMGFTNVKLMIPFIRTVDEAKTVIAEMKKHGLVQGKDGLEIIMMCEIPSNVILIDEFMELFDGASIGSNDLTQTTMALDRDSDLVASLFDERNEAVKRMMKMAIEGAKRSNKPIGICGQAPSDYPEVAKLLVECGINSISLNPDTVVKTMLSLGGSKR